MRRPPRRRRARILSLDPCGLITTRAPASGLVTRRWPVARLATAPARAGGAPFAFSLRVAPAPGGSAVGRMLGACAGPRVHVFSAESAAARDEILAATAKLLAEREAGHD